MELLIGRSKKSNIEDFCPCGRAPKRAENGSCVPKVDVGSCGLKGGANTPFFRDDPLGFSNTLEGDSNVRDRVGAVMGRRAAGQYRLGQISAGLKLSSAAISFSIAGHGFLSAFPAAVG
jgi:hypothetical protein